MDGERFSDFFGESDNFSSAAAASPYDIFSMLEGGFESTSRDYNTNNPRDGDKFEFQKAAFQESDLELEKTKSKKQKLNAAAITSSGSHEVEEGQHRISHITVERQRRKQMNDHLTTLRSLMPSFYVKRGDQASIIAGVVDYINELQQVLQSLQAKKQRKSYTEIISSPGFISPLPSPLISPRKPPLSPRFSMHVSPRTQPVDPSPCNSSTSSVNDAVNNELVASSTSAIAEVEIKFSGSNLVLKTVSHCIRGQVVKIISALEKLALEILQVNINTVDGIMMNFFTIKIGIGCKLSAEELAQEIQHTFCQG